jgi:hypothetical protein
VLILLYFLSFYDMERRGLAAADLVLGKRQMSLHFVADRMFVLPKQSRSLRSEIILSVIVGGDDGESVFCIEIITCRKDAVHDIIGPT